MGGGVEHSLAVGLYHPLHKSILVGVGFGVAVGRGVTVGLGDGVKVG